ncbi:hypothetical protein A2W24_01785 [Microgenomates group bacterium RBG_16_45_19]|nr:MAG: hypothetical protein A2W24_01785 [Microgenomates group bacterium RBG_16_45_19]
MSKLFIDQALLPPQKQIWPQLSLFKDAFYLAGGTGLAVQLGHRISYDYDFFSPRKIEPNLRQQVNDHFPQSRFTLDSTDQLTWITQSGVKITLAYTPHHPLYPVIITDVLRLESVTDIAADKAFTIGRRGQFRDYVDLTAILNSGFKLEGIIHDAVAKYNAMFDEKLFLEQLVYFDDLSDRDVQLLDTNLSKSQVQTQLTEHVSQYVASITGEPAT